MKVPLFEHWKQPIFDAIMRRIKYRQSIAVTDVVDEIGAPDMHREELICMVHSLMSVLQRHCVAFILPDPERLFAEIIEQSLVGHANVMDVGGTSPARIRGRAIALPSFYSDSDS